VTHPIVIQLAGCQFRPTSVVARSVCRSRFNWRPGGPRRGRRRRWWDGNRYSWSWLAVRRAVCVTLARRRWANLPEPCRSDGHAEQSRAVHTYREELTPYWSTIAEAWQTWGHLNPILQCDLSSGQVAAYPARDYINGLSERTRSQALADWESAVAPGALVLFVRDPANQRLQSQVYPPPARRSEPRSRSTGRAARRGC
jgi:hypothetical protein